MLYTHMMFIQRQQLCNQRVDQLRRRFDSGLSLDELLASPDQEEQTVEVCCIPYKVYCIVHYQIRLQHDDAEELQVMASYDVIELI